MDSDVIIWKTEKPQLLGAFVFRKFKTFLWFSRHLKSGSFFFIWRQKFSLIKKKAFYQILSPCFLDIASTLNYSNVLVPTFVTKVTEYLCSGGFFFFRRISTFLLAIFDGIFNYPLKVIDVLSLNLKRYFTCDHFLQSYGGLKVVILANVGKLTRDVFRANNAQVEI